MRVYVDRVALALSPAAVIGKGGEADVYDVGGGRALKLFKGPAHPDIAGHPALQDAARARLAEHQRKLRDFPSSLPPRVAVPLALATDARAREVVGYVMRLVTGGEVLLRYGERAHREATGTRAADVVAIFRDLHRTLGCLHARGVVVGDLNDLNVLVVGHEAHLVDADSFQFGPYLCRAYTERFLDPRLADPAQPRPVLTRPYDAAADWYAYAVMLMRALVYVDPYGGVYRPKHPGDRLPHPTRPLQRITVFHSDVQYPATARPLATLPDALLERLRRIFVHDERGVFPLDEIEAIRWETCRSCGLEHARTRCPVCGACTTHEAPTPPRVVVRGGVTATTVLRTGGTVLAVLADGGVLRWLVADRGVLRREDGSVVEWPSSIPRPAGRLTVRLTRDATLLAAAGAAALIRKDGSVELLNVDLLSGATGAAGRCAIDANAAHAYWADGGRLWRSGTLAPEAMGDVLERQTRFWVGPQFGLGLTRAGDLALAFVFDATARGINDGVKLPRSTGQLIDAECVFGDDRAWLLTLERDGPRTVRRLALVRRGGAVAATAEAEAGDASWLGQLRAVCAAGPWLFGVTDAGVVRVAVTDRVAAVSAEFPDTAPFVADDCQLLAGREGLYLVTAREVRLLQLQPVGGA